MSADVPADLVEAAVEKWSELHMQGKGFDQCLSATLASVLPRYRETLLAEKDAEIERLRAANKAKFVDTDLVQADYYSPAEALDLMRERDDRIDRLTAELVSMRETLLGPIRELVDGADLMLDAGLRESAADALRALLDLTPAADHVRTPCAWCPLPATGRARHNDGLDHPSCGASSHGLDDTYATSPAAEGGDE